MAKARVGRRVSDEELLAGYLRWSLAKPAGDAEFREWLRGYRAWCVEMGTDAFEVHRLVWARRADGSLVHEDVHPQLPGGV